MAASTSSLAAQALGGLNTLQSIYVTSNPGGYGYSHGGYQGLYELGPYGNADPIDKIAIVGGRRWLDAVNSNGVYPNLQRMRGASEALLGAGVAAPFTSLSKRFVNVHSVVGLKTPDGGVPAFSYGEAPFDISVPTGGATTLVPMSAATLAGVTPVALTAPGTTIVLPGGKGGTVGAAVPPQDPYTAASHAVPGSEKFLPTVNLTWPLYAQRPKYKPGEEKYAPTPRAVATPSLAQLSASLAAASAATPTLPACPPKGSTYVDPDDIAGQLALSHAYIPGASLFSVPSAPGVNTTLLPSGALALQALQAGDIVGAIEQTGNADWLQVPPGVPTVPTSYWAAQKDLIRAAAPPSTAARATLAATGTATAPSALRPGSAMSPATVATNFTYRPAVTGCATCGGW